MARNVENQFEFLILKAIDEGIAFTTEQIIIKLDTNIKLWNSLDSKDVFANVSGYCSILNRIGALQKNENGSWVKSKNFERQRARCAKACADDCGFTFNSDFAEYAKPNDHHEKNLGSVSKRMFTEADLDYLGEQLLKFGLADSYVYSGEEDYAIYN